MATVHRIPAESKLKRIDIRITSKVKDLLASAAHITGKTLSGFLLESAYEKAKHIIDEQETIYLNDKERERFLQLLEQPSTLKPKLAKAMQKYLASK